MRSSRTVKKSLVIQIRGVDSEERLNQILKAARGRRHLVLLDNDATLSIKPGGATHHYCIEGQSEKVDDVVQRLIVGRPVSGMQKRFSSSWRPIILS